jgi:LytS/YehU family sensor histidine kinase
MEALELVVKLLEKVSVLVASALVLVLMRPAGVWLGETGARASVRRRLFLVMILGALAIWGAFLGFHVAGLGFNVRMVGIIVAGYLGGVWVGLIVGFAAGLVYALSSTSIAIWVFSASVLVGVMAGMWSRRFGTRIPSVIVGTILIQALYHAAIGTVMAAVDLELAISLASNVMLHVAKITANVVGVILFMGLLNLARELERARDVAVASKDEARSARLEALQYQVRPHFLFNLLNTLAYLIRTDPTKARELTLELAEFLRYTLSRQEDQTTLYDELRQIRRYVDLERARFGDGLRFEVGEISDALASRVIVPPLILQPLVENAIRHGAREGSVTVRVEVTRDDEEVHICVLDDGPGPPMTKPREGGVGLRNVRERLDRFYHGSAQLTLRRRESGHGARAEFSIPVDFDEEKGGLAEQARRRLEEYVA